MPSSTTKKTSSTAATTTMVLLSQTERHKLSTGPRVDFAVGSERKRYYLSKSLLAKYSAVLETLITEAKGDKVYLPSEKAEDFEVLYELLFKGIIPGTTNTKSSIAGSKAIIAQCLTFLETAEKYELGDPSEILYAPLHKAIKDLSYHKARNNSHALGEAAKLKQRCGVDASDIETVFRLCPAESRLRALFTQAALSYSGAEGVKQWEDEMKEIPEFAVELVDQCVSGFAKQNFTDPFTRKEKRVEKPKWRN